MNINQLRKDFETACFNGDFATVKKMVNKYNGRDLDPYPEYSEALSLAMRRKHFDIAEYLLSNEEVKENYLVPLSFIGNLKKFNKEVIEFVLRSDAVKLKFNVFGHEEDYENVLIAACEYWFTEEINYLISSPESEKFWERKMRALDKIATMSNPDLKQFDKIINQILEHPEFDKEIKQKKETEWLFSSLEYPINQTGLPQYLIFDRQIEIDNPDRTFIKERFPECDKLFKARDLKNDLSTELNTKNLIDKKANKV